MTIAKCGACEFRRSKMSKIPGKKIPGGTGKCTRPGGPCDAYVPAGNIGEISETGERKPVIKGQSLSQHEDVRGGAHKRGV